MISKNYQLIAIAILIGVVIFLLHQNQNLKHESQSKDTIIAEKTDSLAFERNDKNQIIASKASAEAALSDLRTAYADELKQIHQELNIKDKNLKAFMKANFQAKGSGTVPVEIHYDTIHDGQVVVRKDSIELNINDGYLNETITMPLFSLHKSIDSVKAQASYRYVYSDEILAAFHYEKDGLFKKKLMWSARLKNPYASVTKTTSAVVEEYKDKRWVVVGGVSYLPFINQVQPSITVGYTFFRF